MDLEVINDFFKIEKIQKTYFTCVENIVLDINKFQLFLSIYKTLIIIETNFV